MPARIRKIRHDDETRAKIQAALIIRRMQDCVDGKVDLSPQQVSCAKTLLGKVLPDLQSVAHKGDQDNPVNVIHRIERIIVGSKDTDGPGIRAASKSKPV